MALVAPGHVISTILKHDAKVTSYKMALLRAINDVVLSFPDLHQHQKDIAVPLRVLAEYWIAYYWPFVGQDRPILQGPVAQRAGGLSNDMAFRPELTHLRREWEVFAAISRPADGFFLINEMRLPRKQALYPQSLLKAYQQAVRSIAQTIKMPVRYAGAAQWTVFDKPQPYHEIVHAVVPIPGTQSTDVCLVIEAPLWKTFHELSLWIEALCIHEWCLFTERVDPLPGTTVERGAVYQLLTDRPDNRRPLQWERNHIDILLMEGKEFICPWTQRLIRQQSYALDHILPVSIYPINELWNLVPADPHFNSHVKRNRLPSRERMVMAKPYLVQAYLNYDASQPLSRAMREDVAIRFSFVRSVPKDFSEVVANAVTDFMEHVATSRNLARF